MVSFTILSVVPVPDLATARQRYQLRDLDDESVAKVLFHRRKQSSGGVESLRWDQCALGAVTLIEHGPERLAISRWSATEHNETSMLAAIHRATLARTYRFSWATAQVILPLLRFRAAVNDYTMPSLWPGDVDGAPGWEDLGDWWTSASHDRPDMDALSTALGLPGLLGIDPGDAMAAWVKGDARAVQSLATLQAFNLYLMAVRVLSVRGKLEHHQLNPAYDQLSAWSETQQDPDLQAFHDAWRASH